MNSFLLKAFLIFFVPICQGCLPGLLVLHEVGDTIKTSSNLTYQRNELREKYPQAYDRYRYKLAREGRQNETLSYEEWIDLQPLSSSDRQLLIQEANRRPTINNDQTLGQMQIKQEELAPSQAAKTDPQLRGAKPSSNKLKTPPTVRKKESDGYAPVEEPPSIKGND